MQSACAVLCCHLWSVWLYRIFPHYLTNGTILGKYLLNIKCVFWFSLQLLSETFLILRRIQRDMVINVHRSSCKVPLFLSDFNVLEFSRQIFKKCSNIKLHENPSSVSRVVPCGQTDMTKLIVPIRNFTKALKNNFLPFSWATCVAVNDIQYGHCCLGKETMIYLFYCCWPAHVAVSIRCP
jgi:hypothetical protein